MGDLESFREETRRWLQANAPERMFTPPADNGELCWGGRKQKYPQDVRRWLEVMAERGWTAPTWPREYGGGGLSREAARVLAAEMSRLRLRPPLVGFGLTMIAEVFGQREDRRALIDIGLFLKRARVAEVTFGDAAYHRDRMARLDGY